MRFFLTKGLTETASLWSDVEQAYTWLHRVAHILANENQQNATDVRQAYERLLTEMEQTPGSSERLTAMLTTFRKVTASYWPGLFHCYDTVHLPRTNNNLEHYFGSARYHERCTTGRKRTSPGYVVRGAVRAVASVASRLHHFDSGELRLTEPTRWRTLRRELDARHEARRKQHRFRTSPEVYLADLEEKLIKESLLT